MVGTPHQMVGTTHQMVGRFSARADSGCFKGSRVCENRATATRQSGDAVDGLKKKSVVSSDLATVAAQLPDGAGGRSEWVRWGRVKAPEPSCGRDIERNAHVLRGRE